MVTAIRRQETHEQAVLRLAQRARESGVRLVQDRTGRYYASSASQPGHWHFVTAFSCDCKGFVSHQRCMHNSALLVAMGFVPTETTPEPTPCEHCQGRGITVVEVEEVRHGSSHPNGWHMPPVRVTYPTGRMVRRNFRCEHCQGTGHIEPMPLAA